MAEPIVQFDDVSKAFLFNPDRAVSLKSAAVNFFSFRKSEPPKMHEALKNVSFSIPRGEFVGILGRNGAGKSTILKIMARVISPTSGRVIAKGRIAPLIELGAGFHPDLTGYENIFLNGSLIGLTKKQVWDSIDRIIDFSELHEFIEMPVRQYSSGMFLRLGFSIAVHTSPDILVVDEVLAVGDQSFQSKCRTRIQEMHKAGTTIVLISHDRDEIAQFCERSILVENGRVIADGETQRVLERYESAMGAHENPPGPQLVFS
jgi:ABC-type polysaccharide/polyol phosphate transport system ATPase subunit